MDVKEVKKELKEYRANKRYIERKQEEIERLNEQICKVTATYSDMPKGGGNSKEDLIAEKLDLERHIYEYLIGLVQQQKKIEQTLSKLEAKHRNVLDGVYIEGITLVEVAVQEHYGYKQAARILKEAYKKYAEVLEE